MNASRVPARAISRCAQFRRALALSVAAFNLLAACALLLLASPFPSALACGTPPPGDCSLTVSIMVIVPQVIIAGPNAVIVPVRTVVFIGGTNGLTGVACPTRGSTDVTLIITCTPGPNPAPPAVVSLPPISGAYTMDIPVTFPAGPPRTCTITGSAVSHYSSPPGMTVMGTSTTQVCIVDQEPGNPSKPRLDLQLISAPSRTAHPGDERGHVYRITNNDLVHSFSGTLSGVSSQFGRMSVMSPPAAPGAGTLPTSAA